MSTIVCYTRSTQNSAPDKTVEPEGKQLRMWIRQVDGHQVARIEADAGFDCLVTRTGVEAHTSAT